MPVSHGFRVLTPRIGMVSMTCEMLHEVLFVGIIFGEYLWGVGDAGEA